MRWRSGRNYDWNISIFIHCCFRFANIISFVRYFFRIFRFDELYRYDYVKHVVISLYLTRISNKNDICSASEPIICIRYGFALFQRQSFFSLICFGSFAQISLYLSLFIYSSGKNSNTWKATCCLYVSVSALVFFFARVCLCVCVFVIRSENRNYILAIRAYANMRLRLVYFVHGTNSNRQHYQLYWKCSWILICVHISIYIYKLIFNRMENKQRTNWIFW